MNRFHADAVLFTFALKLGSGLAKQRVYDYRALKLRGKLWRGRLTEVRQYYSTVSHRILSLDTVIA